MCPDGEKYNSRYFPNLDEFPLMTVRALPKDSSSGFTCRILSSRLRDSAFPSLMKWWIRMLDASVFPAPLSPEIMQD